MKSYTSSTRPDGSVYTQEHDTENEGGGGFVLVVAFILFVVMVVTTLIYNATGTNVFDTFEGVTGPCNYCTTTEGN